MESTPPFWAKKLSSPGAAPHDVPAGGGGGAVAVHLGAERVVAAAVRYERVATGGTGLEHVAAVEADDRPAGRPTGQNVIWKLVPIAFRIPVRDWVPPKPPVATPCCRLTLTPAGACEKSTVLLPPPLMTLPPAPANKNRDPELVPAVRVLLPLVTTNRSLPPSPVIDTGEEPVTKTSGAGEPMTWPISAPERLTVAPQPPVA